MTAFESNGPGGAPLRREVRIPVYWLVVGLMVMVVSPLLSIWVSVQINQKTMAQAQRVQTEARAEALVRYCSLIGSQIDVYAEAQSTVGQRAHDTWLAEYKRSGCQPPRG